MPGVPIHEMNTFHRDPKFGRLLLVSLVVHGLIWLAFGTDWLGSARRPKPPVYIIDLVHKPVLNPQAGRPEPRPAKAPQAVAAPPAPVAPTAVAEPVKPMVAPAPKPTPKPPAAPVVLPKPKAPPTPPVTSKPQAEVRKEQQLQSALDEIRARRERQAERDSLKERLEQLRQSTGAAVVADDVPIGMPDGQGDEAGISALAFVQTYIQQNWALSPYLLDQSRIANLEARALLTYSAAGDLVRYRLTSPSGNAQFDDSLKKAIIKSKRLPQPLPKELDLDVLFNLKDMASARR